MLSTLKDTSRYAGLLLAPAEGFGPQPRAFFALRAKKKLIMLFKPILGHFWCPVVTLVAFSSNVSNFKKNPKSQLKILKKSKKKLNILKNSKKIQKKSFKNPENP